MEFSPEEKSKLKNMLMFLIRKKDQQSEGNCGFSLIELKPIINEMVEEGTIVERPTINAKMYFLK